MRPYSSSSRRCASVHLTQSVRQGWILLTQTAVSIRSGGYTQTDTMYSHCAACVRSGEAIRHFMPYSSKMYALIAFSVLFYEGRQGGLVV